MESIILPLCGDFGFVYGPSVLCCAIDMRVFFCLLPKKVYPRTAASSAVSIVGLEILNDLCGS